MSDVFPPFNVLEQPAKCRWKKKSGEQNRMCARRGRDDIFSFIASTATLMGVLCMQKRVDSKKNYRKRVFYIALWHSVREMYRMPSHGELANSWCGICTTTFSTFLSPVLSTW